MRVDAHRVQAENLAISQMSSLTTNFNVIDLGNVYIISSCSSCLPSWKFWEHLIIFNKLFFHLRSQNGVAYY